MKKNIILLVLLCMLSCQKDSVNNSNQYISNVNFSIDINKTLPAYNKLNYAGEPVLISIPGAGIQGIIVMKTGGGDSYVAWEASCPIQYPTSCSKLSLEGAKATCSCDKTSYNIFTGDGGQQYPLKGYRIEVNNSVIRVYN
ncbi:Rieske (2Fe-2S) protein [Flavobacterium sp.]|uniref:Rieske (2Fe-2S) protein n=1 Tax=Flavobacterium sp. TaxID=239 RepID=UPI003D11F436